MQVLLFMVGIELIEDKVDGCADLGGTGQGKRMQAITHQVQKYSKGRQVDRYAYPANERVAHDAQAKVPL
jgi:hypothetical protein